LLNRIAGKLWMIKNMRGSLDTVSNSQQKRQLQTARASLMSASLWFPSSTVDRSHLIVITSAGNETTG
jgi:hypothetical protein